MIKVAIIGRNEKLYETAVLLRNMGYVIALIITSKEAPEYTKTSVDFMKLADEWEIPFIQTPRITEAIEIIKSSGKIDIGVSINYSGVIPGSVTGLFPLGILNAHGGDLPRYRGNACQAWAILNGEDRIGLCIHRMIGGELDSGDIICRDYLPMDINTKVTHIQEWFRKQIPLLFVEALERLEQNPEYILESQSKAPQDALRCYPRRPEDGRIEWNNTAEEILRLVNASSKPYAGAFCQYDGEKLIIWDAELAAKENYLAVPGQITFIGDNLVEVATGNGKIKVKEVEFKGELIIPAKLVKSIRSRFC